MTAVAPGGAGGTDAGAPVRLGLVGYGAGGRVFHAPVVVGSAGCVLAGVVARAPERVAQVAADHPGTPVHASLTDMIAAGGLDAVVVTTPVATHVDLALEAVRAGLAVLVDKPFALDAASARTVVDAAREAGVALTVYQNRRWDADALTVEAVVASGELGRVVRFEPRMEQATPDGGVPTSGGGVLLDLGAHLVDQALRLFGPVASAYAELDGSAGPGPGPGRAFLALRHRSGAVSHLVGDFALQSEPGLRFRVFGTEATYDAPAFDGQADDLLAGVGPAQRGERWGVVPPERWGRLHRGDATSPWPSERGDWTSLYAGFADAVRGRGPVPVDPEDAVAALVVLEAAQASARTGQVVRVP